MMNNMRGLIICILIPLFMIIPLSLLAIGLKKDRNLIQQEDTTVQQYKDTKIQNLQYDSEYKLESGTHIKTLCVDGYRFLVVRTPGGFDKDIITQIITDNSEPCQPKQ